MKALPASHRSTPAAAYGWGVGKCNFPVAEPLERRRLFAGWTITGRVVDSEPGYVGALTSPLAGATVYADLNGNGVLDAGEPSAISGADGSYTLTGSGAGTFNVREVPPPGGEHFASGESGVRSVTIADGQSIALPDFKDSQTATISGTVFEDLNGNGIQDPGEPSASIRIGNTGNALSTGPVEVQLYASSIDTSSALQVVQLKAGDVSLADVQQNLTIAPGGSRTIVVRFTIPADLAPGKYGLVAVVGPQKAETEAANTAGQDDLGLPHGTVFTVLPPTPDLAISFLSAPLEVASGRRGTAVLRIENDGGVPAGGTASVELFASSDQTPDPTDPMLAETDFPIRLRRGQFRRVLLRFSAAPNLSSGNYYLIGSLLASVTPPDSSTANNTAVSATGTLFN
jgi:hypothetical protein